MEKVIISCDVDPEKLSKCRLIKDWIQRIKPPFELLQAKVTQCDLFGSRIGIVNMEVDYLCNQQKHHENIFLIGKALYILVIFKCIEDNELYTILVSQPRIGSGDFTLEIPAGMLDDQTDYTECALKELKEEVGIKATKNDMIELSDFNFTVPFLCDDHSKYYLFYKTETKENIMRFNNRNTGADEDEVIKLQVMKFNETINVVNESVSLYCMKIFQNKLKKGEIQI